MPGLYYLTQNPQKVASGIETLLRKDLSAPMPLPYQILPGDGAGTTPGSILGDLGKSLIPLPHKTSSLFRVHFMSNWPRPFEVQVTVLRKGVGALVGPFLYIVPLNRPIANPITLGKAKLRISSSEGFMGDAGTVARVNSHRDVIIQAHRQVVSSTTIGRTTLTIPGSLQIVPRGPGSVLILRRLCKVGMFWGMTVGARDLLTFLPALEASLG